MSNDNKTSTNQTKKALQLKRGTEAAFRKANLILLSGQPGYEIDTHRLKIGDGKTRWNCLPYIGEQSIGKDGKSAYQVWLDAGFTGEVQDFLEFCKGEPGKSTYEIWLSLGNSGSMQDFIDSLKGEPGKSYFEVWKESTGNSEATVEDFIHLMGSISWGTF